MLVRARVAIHRLRRLLLSLPMKLAHVATKPKVQAAIFGEYSESYLTSGWLQSPLK